MDPNNYYQRYHDMSLQIYILFSSVITTLFQTDCLISLSFLSQIILFCSTSAKLCGQQTITITADYFYSLTQGAGIYLFYWLIFFSSSGSYVSDVLSMYPSFPLPCCFGPKYQIYLQAKYSSKSHEDETYFGSMN